MYYRDENGKIMEGYDGSSKSSSKNKNDIPTWLIVTLVSILVLLIIFLVFSYIKNRSKY